MTAGTRSGGDAARRPASLAGNAAAVMGSNVATWAIMLVVVAVLSEYIGPADFGKYQLALTVWSIGVVFVVAGLDEKVTLEDSRNHERALTLVPAAFTARLLAFGTVAIAVALLTLALGYTPEERWFIAIVGAATLMTTVGQVANSVLVGREDFIVVSRIGVVVRLAVAVVTLVAVVFLGAGVMTILVLTLVGSAAASVLVIRRATSFGVTLRLATPSKGVEFLRAGTPFLFGAFALALYREVDIFVMRAMLSSEVLGWYAVADRLVGIIITLPFVLLTVAFPRMARLHEYTPDEAGAAYADAFDSSLLVAVPAGLGLACVAHNVTALLLGDEYAGAGPVLAVMGVVLILTFQTTLLGQCALVMNRQRDFAWLLIGAAVLTLPLDLWLVDWADRRYANGAIGGAVSYLITESLLIVASAVLIAPFVVRRRTAVRTLKVGVASTCMVAAVWPLRSEFIALPIAAGLLTYGLVIAALRTTRPEERDRVARVLRRVRRRAKRLFRSNPDSHEPQSP